MIKPIYNDILDLLEQGYKIKDVAIKLDVTESVVKKVSQARSVRSKFEKMELSEEDMNYLNGLWLNINDLKDVESEKGIKDIIELLKTFKKANKEDILISKVCLEQKCKKIDKCEENIRDLNVKKIIYTNNLEYFKTEEFKVLKQSYKDQIQEYKEVIEALEGNKKRFLYSIIGFLNTFKYQSKYPKLCLKRRVDVELFKRLCNKKAIYYNRNTYVCEIIDIRAFIKITLRTKFYRKFDFDKIEKSNFEEQRNRDFFDFDTDYLTEEENRNKKILKEVEIELEEAKKMLINAKKVKLIIFLDYAKEEYDKAQNIINKYKNIDITRVVEDNVLKKIKKDKMIYTKNLFKIDKMHYTCYDNKKIITYILEKDLREEMLCTPNALFTTYVFPLDSEILKDKIEKFLENSLKSAINKIKNKNDEIYVIKYEEDLKYLTPYYKKDLDQEVREDIKFKINRKLNKEFLFL